MIRAYENPLVSLKFRPAIKPGYFWGGVRGPYPTWEFQENHRLKSALIVMEGYLSSAGG